MKARRIVLIRHCATDAGNSGRLVGSTDVSATAEGLAEIERLGPVLEQFDIKSWYCSPQLRAEQTADRLNQRFCMSGGFVVDHRLREIDFGRWEMKNFDEIKTEDPDLVEKWLQFGDFVFPGGEAVSSFCDRIKDVIAFLQRETSGQVGIITHGGVIRTMICLALGLGAERYLLFDIHPCRAAVLDLYPEGGVLTGLNL